MITEPQKNKMMQAENVVKKFFHFAGDGTWCPRAIWAATIEEAEKIWHEVKVPLIQPNPAEKAEIIPSKVEDKDKSTDEV